MNVEDLDRLIRRNYRSFRVNGRTQGDVSRTMAGVHGMAGATPVRRLNAPVRLRVAIVPNKYPYRYFSRRNDELLHLRHSRIIV